MLLAALIAVSVIAAFALTGLVYLVYILSHFTDGL